jgi:hypothetical protein
MGPPTVVMETLPFGHASRTAAIALRHGLARLVPYSAPATQRTTTESRSRHFYKGSLAARWLEVPSGAFFGSRERIGPRVQQDAASGSRRGSAYSITSPAIASSVGGTVKFGRLGGSSFDDRLDSCRLREGQASQPTRAANLFRFQLSF